MEARFHSDGSGNDWGYKFTVSFFAKAPVGMTPFFKVISPAMSCLPLSYFIQHGLHCDQSLPDADCKLFALYERGMHWLMHPFHDTTITGLLRVMTSISIAGI